VKDTWEALKAYTIGGKNTLSSVHFFSFLRLTSFSGTPEAGPGTILGHPIRFMNATKDGATPKSTGSGVPPTTSSTCTSTRGSGLNGCAFSGTVLGRVAAFSIICAAIFYLRRRRPQAQSLSGDVHHPQMENTWKSPSDRALVDASSLTETLTAMTKPYVRIFVPCVTPSGGRSNSRDPSDSPTFPRIQKAPHTVIMSDQVSS
jgi:hypothetical protein